MNDRIAPTSRPKSAGGAAICLTGLVVGLVGCTAAVAPATSTRQTLDFTGPWAADFARAYNESDDEFVRAVVADSVVSEAEYSETTDSFRECMAARSVVVDAIRFDGSSEFSFDESLGPDVANQASIDCGVSSGFDWIGTLYADAHRNPQKLDEREIFIDCLVRLSAVPRGYTYEQYLADALKDQYPFADEEAGRRTLKQCNLDPLELSK